MQAKVTQNQQNNIKNIYPDFQGHKTIEKDQNIDQSQRKDISCRHLEFTFGDCRAYRTTVDFLCAKRPCESTYIIELNRFESGKTL